MKTRNAYESHSRHSLWLRVLAALMCVLLGFSLVNIALSRVDADVNTGIWGKGTLFNGTIDLDKEYKQEDLDAAMHIIIRHWHSKDNPDANDEDAEDTTVIVGAYIIPDTNGNIVDTNGKKYTCYARAYKSKDEPKIKIHKQKYVKVTTATESNYISVAKSTVANGDSVFFLANPFSNGDADNHMYYERFAGFSVSAGQPAVTIHNGNENVEYSDAMLEINPAKVERMHLVKSHLFYISELSLVNGEEQKGNGQNDNFGKYKDTRISGKKYYNSSKGLHTDKTATENTTYNNKFNDKRNFDLDLEVWHNDGAPVNVGMVLDASGSMGFTANTPKPIRVFDEKGNLTDTFAEDESVIAVKNTLLSKTNKNLSLNDAFLTDEQLALFMNPRKTDNSSIRSSSYTYFLYDARTGTEEFTPLAYWDGYEADKIGSNYFARNADSMIIIGQITYGGIKSNNKGNAGWYYNNPTGNWLTNYYHKDAQSGKNLIGIPDNFNVPDKIVLSNLRKPDLEVVDDHLDANYAKADTNRTFAPSGDSPCKFYIDSDGYLRCLYYIASNNDTSKGDVRFGASYVYENNDQDYIKVEALQRALGAFMTGLNSDSPESLVSAVRFSTDQVYNTTDKVANDLNSLILMDWTSNILEAQQVLSNQRGADTLSDDSIFFGTRNGTKSKENGDPSFCLAANLNGINQFNYGLTGSTSTKQGLNAFYGTYDANKNRYDSNGNLTGTYKQDAYNLFDRLAKYEKETRKNGKKYLIVFTDGKDTDLDKTGDKATAGQDAVTTAKLLRDAGYTIFCVMLTGGPIQKGSDDYTKAYNFLKSISGVGKGNVEMDDDRYVFSTQDDDVREEAAGNSVDALVNIFTKANGILDKMTEDLKNYTVQDYIDPRFDLVDADGNVWKLNADGEVVINGTKYKLSGSNSKTIELYNDRFDSNLQSLLTISSEEFKGAEKAELYFDKNKDMYYLKWTGQTIPTTYEGASKMKIWHSKVTVRAKDDFLGGNAVLTNGNDETQNYVYYSGDRGANSGVTDTIKSSSNPYPSRGFPRTTVNITPAEAKTEQDLEIYMGDSLYTSVIEQLIKTSVESKDYTTAYFWEYLERYVDYYNKNTKYRDILKPKFTGIDDDEALNKLTDADGKISYEKLAQAIFNSKTIFGVNSTVQLPYGYLPNQSDSNQTGLEIHETDIMGYLAYNGVQTDSNGAYEKKDTNERKFETNITFDPFDISDSANNKRAAANTKLVKDDDYRWDRDYKEEVGDPSETNEIPGKNETRIVSGEIALQAYLAEKEVQTLRKAGITSISYKSDLMHKIQGADDSAEYVKVGTFVVEISIDPTTGNVLQNATVIDYSDDYDFVRGSMDVDKSERIDYGLQFGVYTMTSGETTYRYSDGSVRDSGPIKFKPPVVIKSEDDYDDNPFELNIKGNDDPWGYHGKFGDSEIELGERIEDETTGQSTPNLNSRFGIFRVTGTATLGNLSIDKTVMGTGDKTKEFEFIVKLTPPYDGLMNDGDKFPYEYTKADGTTKTGELIVSESVDDDGVTYYTGTVKLKLKHGDSVVIKNIPATVKYTVIEDENSSDGYASESEGNNDVIEDSKTKSVSFTNSPIALSVTKQVMIDPLRKLNNLPDLDNIYFDFEIELHDAEYMNKLVDAVELKYSSSDDAWIYQVDSVTVATADNGLLVTGEADADGNPVYATTNDGNYYIYVNNDEAFEKVKADTEDATDDPSQAPTEENADDSEEEVEIDPAIQIFYVNAILVPVSEVGDGWIFNSGTAVEYPVYQSDVSGAGNALNIQTEPTYKTRKLEFVENVAQFTLRDGEGLLLSGLPTGMEYTIRELIGEDGDFFFNHANVGNTSYDVAEDYDEGTEKLTYTVTGDISNNKNSAVHYFNSTLDFRLPLTGGNTVVMIYVMIAGMLLILSGAIVLICLMKRRTQY